MTMDKSPNYSDPNVPTCEIEGLEQLLTKLSACCNTLWTLKNLNSGQEKTWLYFLKGNVNFKNKKNIERESNKRWEVLKEVNVGKIHADSESSTLRGNFANSFRMHKELKFLWKLPLTFWPKKAGRGRMLRFKSVCLLSYWLQLSSCSPSTE